MTRLGVRARTGTDVRELVIAYPWRNERKAEELGYALGRVLDRLAEGPDALATMITEEGERLAAVPRGPGPRLIKPTIPVVAITGTNGKTTTSRMIGYIAQQTGLIVGWSSTDGVYLNGELVEAGDYSGSEPAPARCCDNPGCSWR